MAMLAFFASTSVKFYEVLPYLAKQDCLVWKWVLLLILFIFGPVVFYEVYPLFRRFWKKKFPPKMYFGTFSREYFTAVREVARRQLLNPPPPLRSPSGHLRTEALLRRVIKGEIQSKRNDWPNSCLALGLCTSLHCFGEDEDLKVLEKHCDQIIDNTVHFYHKV